jgi:hypothetical protein
MASAFARLFFVLTLVISALPALAQFGNNGGFGRSVGGVSIDPQGVVRAATTDEKAELAKLIKQSLQPAEGDLGVAVPLRMVSLQGLQQAIVDHRSTNKPFPETIEFLAGLTRVEFVFVDVENKDLVLAGPGEPWVLRPDGSVVGKVTGMPSLRLEDLIVALRSVESARRQGISCSIEPTPEGRQRLQQMLSRIKLQPGQNPTTLEPAMREAFGPQQILLTGIPTDSRFARTIVAADFEMKRIAMQLIESPVAGLPSYLELSKNAMHSGSANPRWWMTCSYDALLHSEDSLAWKLSGPGVKTLTEQDIIATDGTVAAAGRADKNAQKWADLMTAKFQDLAREMTVFGELRNVMDLSVVATLIVQEGLADRAGLDLCVLNGCDNSIEMTAYGTPKSLEPQCSFVRGRSGWVATASGGVSVNAFEIVNKRVVDSNVESTRAGALASDRADRWWWQQASK